MPVAVYHLVTPTPVPPNVLAVTPARFERHVRALSRFGFTGITPRAWLDHVRQGTALPRRPVILTFDDAYADLCEYAFPVLERHGYGAAVYVVSRRVGDFPTWSELPELAQFRLMTADEIRDWSARGVEFGAHSQTHPNLRELATEEIEREVRGSAEDLEALLGFPPASFAYPFGSFDDRVVDSARTVFRCAFSIRGGLADLEADPWRLNRFRILQSQAPLDMAILFRLGWSPKTLSRRVGGRLVQLATPRPAAGR